MQSIHGFYPFRITLKLLCSGFAQREDVQRKVERQNRLAHILLLLQTSLLDCTYDLQRVPASGSTRCALLLRTLQFHCASHFCKSHITAVVTDNRLHPTVNHHLLVLPSLPLPSVTHPCRVHHWSTIREQGLGDDTRSRATPSSTKPQPSNQDTTH